MRWFLGFVALAVTFFSPPARAQGHIDCSALQSHILKRNVHYCVQVPGSYEQKTRPASRDDIRSSTSCTVSATTNSRFRAAAAGR